MPRPVSRNHLAPLLMLAMLAMPVSPAMAQRGSCVSEDPYAAIKAAWPDPTRSRLGNVCINALHDGRASVRLPSAGVNIDDAAASDGSTDKWGYLDKDGKLVIPPTFDMALNFRHGLAAVSMNGLWGYVDLNGKWAIKPRFLEADAFTSLGLAMVREGVSYELIDRSGTMVGKPFPAGVKAYLAGGKPGFVYLSYGPEWRSSAGATFSPPDGVFVVKPLGGQDLFIARSASRRYGVMDANGKWIVLPDFQSLDASVIPDGLALARGYRRSALIRDDGTYATDRHVKLIRRLGRHFWLTRDNHGVSRLLDEHGKVAHDFGKAPLGSSLVTLGPFVLWSTDTDWQVFVPGRAAPVSIPRALQPKWSGPENGVLLWRNLDTDAVAGILTRAGRWLVGPGWIADIAFTISLGGQTAFTDRRGSLLNVLDADGNPLLTSDAARGLAHRQVQPLHDAPNSSKTPVAIAILGPCDCDPETGSGLLLSDGHVVQDKAWKSIHSLDPDDSKTSTRVSVAHTTIPQRFAVDTAAGTGMMDVSGKMLLAADQKHIGAFQDGLALVSGRNGTRVMDRAGKLYSVPDYFALESAGAGLLRFRETAKPDALWGLYSVAQAEIAVKPAFKSIGAFESGTAVAQDSSGATGVIDTRGRWVVPARYAAVEPLNRQLWVVRGGAAQTDGMKGVVARDDQVVVTASRGLKVHQNENGLIRVSFQDAEDPSRRGAWLLDQSGKRVMGGSHADIEFMKPWWLVLRPDSGGYVGKDGNWVIPPAPGLGTAFHGSQGAAALAVRNQGKTSLIIDEKGRVHATLQGGDWAWPDGSDWLVRQVGRDGKEPPETLYADTGGKIRLTVKGAASEFVGDYAVLRSADGRHYGWIDKQGHEGPAHDYDWLGLPSDGLAFASEHGLYGYLNERGQYVIAPAFKAATPFVDGRAVVSTRLASMIIDTKGTPLARVTYLCGVRVLFDANNHVEWPKTLPSGCR
ncbi:MAG TPA: WG repeat-containing protein [Burkholderiaceae bacterium]|nr:WG repeat-containing protein [Burkholderiaceae bacterium]